MWDVEIAASYKVEREKPAMKHLLSIIHQLRDDAVNRLVVGEGNDEMNRLQITFLEHLYRVPEKMIRDGVESAQVIRQYYGDVPVEGETEGD